MKSNQALTNYLTNLASEAVELALQIEYGNYDDVRATIANHPTPAMLIASIAVYWNVLDTTANSLLKKLLSLLSDLEV